MYEDVIAKINVNIECFMKTNAWNSSAVSLSGVSTSRYTVVLRLMKLILFIKSSLLSIATLFVVLSLNIVTIMLQRLDFSLRRLTNYPICIYFIKIFSSRSV